MPNWKKIIVSGSDASLNNLTVSNTVQASTITGSLLRLAENGTGLRLTNIGAFEKLSGETTFHIFSNNALRFSTDGASNEALTLDTNQNATFHSNTTVSGTFFVSGNILPNDDNVFSLGTTDNRFQLNGGTPVTVTGSGVQNFITRFNAPTSVETSSIFSSNDETRIIHDNDTNVIFTISGSNGELFTVTDDNSGNLLEVNDASGIDVFSVDAAGNVTASGEVSASGFNISNNITASFITGSFTGSFLGDGSQLTGVATSTGSFTGSFTGSILGDVTGTASIADSSVTASYGHNMTASNLFVEGTASITYLESIYETSSVIYASGSTKFGDDTSDTHEITGSLLVSGNAQFVDILGVANEIVMVGSNNSLTSSTILSLDPANNYIGINQPNPEVTLHMTGDGAQTAQIRMEQFNDTSDAPDIRTRKARGTSAAPTAPNAGDFLFRQNIERYNGTGYSTMHSQQFDLSSGDATKGVYQLQTDIGSGLADRMLIDDEGNVRFTSATTSSFFTGSFTGSFLGDIVGTATTASHVVTASFADRANSASIADELSQLATASFADQATTASQADNATTASHVVTSSFAITASHALNVPDTASHALTAVTASHTIGTASFANTATTSSYSLTGDGVFSGSFSGSYNGDGSNLTGIDVASVATITDTFTAETSVTVSHNFVTENVLVTAYTDNGEQLLPQTIRTLDDNNVGVDFASSTTGRIVVAKGGHIVSGSVLTASLALELSNLATASIANTATTASHTAGTASIANLATTASIADLATTASQADNATTASHVVTASFADNATTSSFAVTASYALNADGGGGGGIGAVNDQTFSQDFHVSQSDNQLLVGPIEIDDGTVITVEGDGILYVTDFSAPTLVDSASFAETASFVETSQTSSLALVSNNSTTVTNQNSSNNLSFWQGTQAQYDLISASADSNTVYFVV